MSKITIDREKLEAFCRRWKVRELALFGSVLRDDFRPDSDVDVLVVFDANAHWDFEHLQEMRKALEGLCGRSVDLVEKRLIEQSENYIRRKHILSSAERVYVAR